MSKTTKYILFGLFLGLCVFVRWKCVQPKSLFCGIRSNKIEVDNFSSSDTLKDFTEYAKYFGIIKTPTIETINYDKDGGLLGLLKFTPLSSHNYIPKYLNKANTVVCLSSVYVGYLAALGLEDKIVGVDNLDYVSNEEVRSNPSIVQVGNLGQLNMEALLALNPKYVFADDFEVAEGLSNKLKDAGILLVKCNPFREETPLARAEWIKFFGIIFNEYDKACTLFEDTKLNYHLLKNEAEKYKVKPTVFLNAPFGEQWTIPGGKSFQARLMKDAGAEYVFAQDTSSMTIHTGFEEMLTTARSADYWLHLGIVSAKDAFLKNNQNFDKFKAFKEGNLYNNNKNTNLAGGIPYWETSGVHPDWVLEDLVRIFHPNSSLDYKFHYYQKLK